VPYTTPSKVRDEILGVDATIAPDAILEKLIDISDRHIIRELTIKVERERLRHVKEKVYATSYYPLADVTADTTVSPADVRVFTDEEEVTVNYVLSDLGLVILDERVDEPYIDYSYWLRKPDWELVSHASSLLAGHKFYLREVSLYPEDFRLGALRMRLSRVPALYAEYLRVMELLKPKALKTLSPKPLLPPTYVEKPPAPAVVLVTVKSYSFDGLSKSVATAWTTYQMVDVCDPKGSFIPLRIEYGGTNADPSVTLYVSVRALMLKTGEVVIDTLSIAPGTSDEADLLASYISSKLPSDDEVDEIRLYARYDTVASEPSSVILKSVSGYLLSW